MDKAKRKALKEQYLRRKPEMGIISFLCKENDHRYLGAFTDTTAYLNSFRARLDSHMFRGRKNHNIQEDWLAYGEDGFVIEVVDVLEYDKEDEEKADYSEELAMLLEDWLKKYPQAEEIL